MFDDPTLQTKAIRELVQSAAFVNDELKRSILLKTIAKKFNIREKLLESELEKFLKLNSRKNEISNRSFTERANINSIPNLVKGSIDKIPKVVIQTDIANEDEIIKLLFEGNRSIIEFIFQHISPEDLMSSTHRYLANIVFDSLNNNESIIPAVLIEKIENEEIKQYVLKLAFDRYIVSKTWEEFHPGAPEEIVLEKAARDVIKSFKILRIDKEIKINYEKIKSAKEEDEKVELMKLNNSLQQEKRMIQQDIG